MAAKKATKGKRYSAEEKKAAIDFVNAHNNDNGRSGVTAAVKKFGASALTISTWMKSTSSGARSGKGIATTRLATGGNRSKVLGELYKLDQVIAAKRKELNQLEAKFERLKASL